MTNPSSTTECAAEQQCQPINLAEFRSAMADLELEDILDELVETFLSDAPERMGAIEAAVESSDAEEIRKAAHAYKSAAANMYAEQLTYLLTRLENAGAEGDCAHAVVLLPVVRAAHHAATAQFKEQFG